jgi:formylglycine-generating enzyme required for sulfatase activity
MCDFSTLKKRSRFLKSCRMHSVVGISISVGALFLVNAWRLCAGEGSSAFKFDPGQNIIPAPDDPGQWLAYRQALDEWRAQTKAALQYNDALYGRKEFAWSSANYSCCFLMLCDESIYDRHSGNFTVDAFLDHGRREFGGYDSVVLWHAYPRIGVDQRNQFDFYRDLPGGLDGLRDVVHRFQRRGVRVYIDYNPWDTGTRREGKPDLDALVDMVRATDADGIFLDTMTQGAAEFRARLDAARPGVVLEGEGALPPESLHDHHASWAQGFRDSAVPGVLRNKWLERRHMQHQIQRWNHDHTGELQAAWMNGSGMMVWENVFGSRVSWSRRDRSILRSMLSIQRRFAGLFSGEAWTPLVRTGKPGVYASLWEVGGVRLWTLVNRSQAPVEGTLLKVPAQSGTRYLDLIAGRAASSRTDGETLSLAGTIPPRGIGCFLSAPAGELGPDFDVFLESQARLNARSDFDPATPQTVTRLRSAPSRAISQSVPPGMVEVPAVKLDLKITMRTRECGFYDSAPAEGEMYRFNVREFVRTVAFKRFAVDETPVTNAQFAEFLRASAYRPRFPENFLKHWTKGRPPVGMEDHPVVYVDLDDARAYAKWAGKRLPTEEEWQYAAQGTDGRKYPWGDTIGSNRFNDGRDGTTTPVRAFPKGRSPVGCYDMCGNVWQWTESERSDGRTRFCIIRGGSYFSAQGSGWYVDGGLRPVDFATKFLLAWPGLDRCSTISFRCIVDLP